MTPLIEETWERILIVDEDAINRGILKNVFSEFYLVDEAENGREGLRKIFENAEKYSAVLLDVMLPEMNGIEILRHMKTLGMDGKMPVFLITAETSAEMIKEAYDLGAMDVISKPVVPYLALRRVKSMTELFSMRKKLKSTVEMQKNELLKRNQKIAELNQGMIEALAAAIEFRSVESGSHVGRIRDITGFILKNTPFGDGLDEKQVTNISLAALMHDVGKIAIPDSILNKPGQLSAEEFEIMKTHTVRGAELLEKIPNLKSHEAFSYACDIARHHHERWDGRGYPDNLKGDEISPWAQVVSLADVYDALSCKRVYKEAFLGEKVVEMIKNGECGAFNPRLLKCFFSVERDIRVMYYKNNGISQ